DAAACRTEPPLFACVVLGSVEALVVGHDQVCGGADAQAAGSDFTRAELVQLGHEQARMDRNTRADNAHRARVEDARWHEVECESASLVAARGASVGAAVPADDQVRVARQEVDDFAFAFVAPMTANNCRDWHGFRSYPSRARRTGRRPSRYLLDRGDFAKR